MFSKSPQVAVTRQTVQEQSTREPLTAKHKEKSHAICNFQAQQESSEHSEEQRGESAAAHHSQALPPTIVRIVCGHHEDRNIRHVVQRDGCSSGTRMPQR
jgi:hypothetical protein